VVSDGDPSPRTALLVEDDGGVRVLTLSGPGRLNAIGDDTADALHDEIVRAERTESVHALVLTGEGGHFSAGGDASGVLGLDDVADDTTVRFMRSYQRAASAVWHSSLPVIAAVSGIAYGGALNLALSCDLVVCARNARLCEVFVKRGVVPDFGGAFTLPRLVGMHRAMELVLLGDEVSGEQAEKIGLVNVVVETPEEALSEALRLAHRIAARPRLSVSLSKKLLHEGAAGTFGSLLESEALAQTLALDSRGARTAFAEFSRGGRPAASQSASSR
jgi:2-(1,2-epoxy-1,2-dihydrophenyl)acetyl-CoA isomerase